MLHQYLLRYVSVCTARQVSFGQNFSALLWSVALGREGALDLFLSTTGGAMDFGWARKVRTDLPRMQKGLSPRVCLGHGAGSCSRVCLLLPLRG